METNSSLPGSSNNSPSILLNLSKLDTEIAIISQRLKNIAEQKNSTQKELLSLKTNFDKLAFQHQDTAKKLKLEEEKVEAENKKIIERRKQLTSLGGTKSAKLMEREVDIAARTLQTMEQKVLQMMEDTEKQKTAAEKAGIIFEQKQHDFEKIKTENEILVTDLSKRQEDFKQRREELLTTLDEKVKSLYAKITARYPAGAIAQVVSGSCRICFAAIRPQVFNQVLSGELHQCPSCSRILIIIND